MSNQKEARGFIFNAGLQLSDGIQHLTSSRDLLIRIILSLSENENKDELYAIFFTIYSELLSGIENALLKAEKLRNWIALLLDNNLTYWEKIIRRKKQPQEIPINDVQILLRFFEPVMENLETDTKDFKDFARWFLFPQGKNEEKKDAGLSNYLMFSPLKSVNKAIKNLNETNKLLLEAELLLLEPDKSLVPQNWDFITDKELQNIIARDYQELANLLQINANKSIIIMCGSIIEASLVSVLKDQDVKAKQAFQQKYGNSPRKIEDWKLIQLISVANELSLLDNDTKIQADILRDYRNLIHPTAEVRKATTLDNELVTVEIALLKRILKSLNPTAKTI